MTQPLGKQCQFYILLTLEIHILQKSLTAPKIEDMTEKRIIHQDQTMMFLRYGILTREETGFHSTTICLLNLQTLWLGECPFEFTLIKLLICESTKLSPVTSED